MSMRPRRTNNPPSKSTQGRLEGVSKGRTSTIYMSSSPSYQKSTNNARNSMALVLSHEGELITRPISAPYISKSRSMEAPNSVLCKNNERPKLKRKKVKSSKAPSDKVVIGKSVAETRISARKRASRSPELAGKIDRKSFEKVRGRSSEKDKSLVVSLTKSVQIVTHNLEEVSSKLKDLTSTLSESMHLSLSMQREASNALALSLTPGVTYPNKTPASAQKATWSTGKPLAAAELASSPESHVEKLENRDSELGNLIRQRMHEKLRDIINPSFSI